MIKHNKEPIKSNISLLLNIEKLCKLWVSGLDSNWKDNNFILTIKDDGNNNILLSTFGLRKVLREEKVSMSRVLKRKTAISDLLYRIIDEINTIEIFPEEIEIKYQCGRGVDVNLYTYDRR